MADTTPDESPHSAFRTGVIAWMFRMGRIGLFLFLIIVALATWERQAQRDPDQLKAAKKIGWNTFKRGTNDRKWSVIVKESTGDQIIDWVMEEDFEAMLPDPSPAGVWMSKYVRTPFNVVMVFLGGLVYLFVLPAIGNPIKVEYATILATRKADSQNAEEESELEFVTRINNTYYENELAVPQDRRELVTLASSLKLFHGDA